MLSVYLALLTGPGAAPPPSPEVSAVAYLSRRVPIWPRVNGCYACHHNGDAARALYAAVRRGHDVPKAALTQTTDWLSRPAGWDKNGGDGPFSDKRLARLQFAAALADAIDAGLATDRRALPHAARLLLEYQDKDGCWPVVGRGTLGGPTTYGTALATAQARQTLVRAGAKQHVDAIRRADAWLRQAPVDSVLDAAGVLLGLGRADDAAAVAQRRRCLDRLGKGEAREGGWGPYVSSAPEVFDTAVVLLALAGQTPTEQVRAWTRRGRAFLLATQETDGSWPETTRPAGGESYAQRLSTSGWATRALLATSSRGTAR